MTIEKRQEGNRLIVALSGRLDTTTVGEFAKAMEGALDGIEALEFDMTGLSYISSAGLRELFRCKKAMDGVRGSMVVRECNEDLMEIFEITGFIDLMEIEPA